MEVNDRNGHIVATFPIGLTDGVMLVSDGGQVIRTSVEQVRIAGRRTQGVTLFKVAAGRTCRFCRQIERRIWQWRRFR
jgi:DNA gyrase subunit A